MSACGQNGDGGAADQGGVHLSGDVLRILYSSVPTRTVRNRRRRGCPAGRQRRAGRGGIARPGGPRLPRGLFGASGRGENVVHG